MFSKTYYMLIVPLFSFDQGREMAFLFVQMFQHFLHRVEKGGLYIFYDIVLLFVIKIAKPIDDH